jgi:hypothetical protein
VGGAASAGARVPKDDEIIEATDPERLSFMIRDDYFRRDGSRTASPPE